MTKTTIYYPKGLQGGEPASDYLVSSIQVGTFGSHDAVSVFSRGGHAGMLTMTAGDGKLLAERLGLEEKPRVPT